MEKKEEKMSYDLIYQVYQRERQGAALSKLEKDFYDKVAGLIKGLKDEYDTESRTNASSTKCMLLYDELKKVRTLFREIYEYRIRKIALLALTGASEGSADTKNLIGMEGSVFDQMMMVLRLGYDEIGRVEQGSMPAQAIAPITKSLVAPAPSPETVTPSAIAVNKPSDAGPREVTASADKGRGAPDGPGTISAEHVHPTAPTSGTSVEVAPVKRKKLVAVQILEDIPKFAGEGGEVYILKRKDYASLPQIMAERLEKMGKARIMPS